MNGALLLVGIGVVLLAVLLGARPFFVQLQGIRVSLEALPDAFRAGATDEIDSLRRDYIALAELVDRLPSKWEDIKRESNSLYKRAQHHTGRVVKELEARGLRDPELDDLGTQLQLVDADGSGGETVSPVHSNVESPQPAAPPTEADWLTLANQRKFGA